MKIASHDSTIAKLLLDFLVLRKDFPCDVYHLLGQSCNGRQYEKVINVIKSLLKINIPIHLLPFIIYKLKTLK